MAWFPYVYRMMLFDPSTNTYISPFPHDDLDNVIVSRPGETTYMREGPRNRNDTMPTEDLMRLRAGKLGDVLDDINANYDEYSSHGYYGDRLRDLAGGYGELGGAQVIVGSSPDYKGRLVRSFGPHREFSALGKAGGDFTIIRDVDVSGGLGERARGPVKDLESRLAREKSLAGLLQLNKAINGNFLSKAVAGNFMQSDLFRNHFSKSKTVQKMLDKNGGILDFDDVKNIIASSETAAIKDLLPNRQARKDLKDFLAKESGNYIPAKENGKDFFDNPSQLFKDAMHDRLVDSVFETFMNVINENSANGVKINPENIRFLQVAAPVSGIVTHDDVLKGDATSQRDMMNELLVNSFTIQKDKGTNNMEVGNLADLTKPGGPLWNYYTRRIRGESGEEAWKHALGEKWGNIMYLLSDEEEKEVRKGMRSFLDKMERHRNIAGALTKGPGA